MAPVEIRAILFFGIEGMFLGWQILPSPVDRDRPEYVVDSGRGTRKLFWFIL
jgi:hypothetical protein